MFDFFKRDSTKIAELKKELSELHMEKSSMILEMSRKDLNHSFDMADIKKQYQDLRYKFEDLAHQLNEKGGWAFLKKGVMPDRDGYGRIIKNNLTPSQIKDLMVLCHPDKHGTGAHGELAKKLFIELSEIK